MTPEQIAAAMPHIEAAAANGFLVFPMTSGKEPRHAGWQTKVWDLGVLAGVLRQPGIMGYGITLPKDDPRRIVDLDLDDGRDGPGDGPTWQQRLEAIEAEHGPLPPTKVTRTPSGGVHRWYLWPEDVPLPGGTWHGFTTRVLHTARNYVIGPGSIRRDGVPYVNEAPGTPIAELPPALAGSDPRGTAGGGWTGGSDDDCCQPPGPIARGPGGRLWLLEYAAHLRAAHGIVGGTARKLMIAALPLMDPPYPPGEGEGKIDAILASDAKHTKIDRGGRITLLETAVSTGYPEPEDRGHAVLSPMGDVEYVKDLARPGRIVVVPAEEGTGKTVAILGELAIRYAVAGGSFAETWPIVEQGRVLVLSEQHPDDDYRNEARVLEALGHTRSDLEGRLFRLSTMTAAGERPPLMDAEWRSWVVDWMRDHDVRMFIVDTATGATQVDPWGKDMQTVYRALRGMVEALPDLVIVLLMHLKKPTGRGERRISDVLGEWGRWCDVILLMEGDGEGRVRLSTRKRVRQQRRILAMQRDYLLVDPIDLTQAGPVTKVAPATVLAAIAARPGITYADLGAALEVSKDTARRYAQALGEAVIIVAGTNKSPAKVYPRPSEGPEAPKPRAAPPTAAPHSDAHAHAAPLAVPDAPLDGSSDAATHAPYRGAVRDAALPPTDHDDETDLTAVARAVFGDMLAEAQA